jgi:predicted phage-related endonuclease
MALIARDPDSPAVVPQGTPAWVRERIGHLTASNMWRAMATTKKGESAERVKLKHELLAERLADAAVDHYITSDMQWGLDNEPAAREEYQRLSGFDILPAGFVRHRHIEFFGASPDGFVVPDGLVEFKCPRTTTHIAWMLAGVVPEQHKPQMLAQCACAGRKWVDFVSFDPRLPERQRMFVRRFTPTHDEIVAVEQAAHLFLTEVESMFSILTETV